MIDRRDFLKGMAAALGMSSLAGGQEGGRKTNVVWIVVDDLGYGDLGCYGSREIPTPNIDQLARRGVRFTDAYASSPVCSPTRAGLLTGRYQQRFGHEFNPWSGMEGKEDFGLPLSERTVAEEMKAAGYATGLVGKWHLGTLERFHPQRRGFDEFFGFRGGKHPYFPNAQFKGTLLQRGVERVEEEEYLTHAFTREAIGFIERHKDRPFFLYLAYNAPHVPLEAPKEYIDRFAHIADEKRRTLAAMMAVVDDGIAAVVKKLEELSLTKDTLVVFISDNGGNTIGNASQNGALSGEKGDLREGGIRVPCIMRWDGVIETGKVYGRPVSSLDLFPTTLAAAGTKAERAVDGVNLLSYLREQTAGDPHEVLYWRLGTEAAVRKEKWKWYRTPEGLVRLYDLSIDPGETKDLSRKDRAVTKELGETFAAWSAQLAAPRWSQSPPPKARRGRGDEAEDE